MRTERSAGLLKQFKLQLQLQSDALEAVQMQFGPGEHWKQFNCSSSPVRI
jgi:hypothetical protein